MSKMLTQKYEQHCLSQELDWLNLIVGSMTLTY